MSITMYENFSSSEVYSPCSIGWATKEQEENPERLEKMLLKLNGMVSILVTYPYRTSLQEKLDLIISSICSKWCPLDKLEATIWLIGMVVKNNIKGILEIKESDPGEESEWEAIGIKNNLLDYLSSE